MDSQKNSDPEANKLKYSLLLRKQARYWGPGVLVFIFMVCVLCFKLIRADYPKNLRTWSSDSKPSSRSPSSVGAPGPVDSELPIYPLNAGSQCKIPSEEAAETPHQSKSTDPKSADCDR